MESGHNPLSPPPPTPQPEAPANTEAKATPASTTPGATPLSPPPAIPANRAPAPVPKAAPAYSPPWAKAKAENKQASAAAEIRAARRRTSKTRQRIRRYIRRTVCVSFMIFVYWFYNPHGIFVLGDPLSVARYRGVLSDLKRQMPAEYELVRDHIDKIKIAYIITGGNYAGYAQEGKRGDKKITLLENTFIQGPGYAHSVLVHEACHGLQFEKGLPFLPFCENQAREHACNQWGLKVLYKFKGDPETIQHYENIAIGDSVYGNSCLREGKVSRMPEL